MTNLYNSVNNIISTGSINPVKSKKIKSRNVQKTKSSGLEFVTKLREEIETEIRIEYENRLNELLSSQTIESEMVLSNEELIAQRHEILNKQYNRLLSLCEKYPEFSKFCSEFAIGKKLYSQ